jgi:hypothetical protein
MDESRPPVAAAAICFCLAASAEGELKSGMGGGLMGCGGGGSCGVRNKLLMAASH